jgi:hypothetical protein
MEIIFTFFKVLFYGFYFTSPLLLAIIVEIIILGQIVGRVESWDRFDALYWSFITGTTVGYGDLRPSSKISKVLSVLIALTGLIFTGIIVALAIQAATYAFSEHLDLALLKEVLKK